MTSMIGVPWFFVIAFIVALALIYVVSKKRQTPDSGNLRRCNACGATHPPVAQFCRRCGQRL